MFFFKSKLFFEQRDSTKSYFSKLSFPYGFGQSFFFPFTGPLGTRLGFSQKFGDPSEEVDEKSKMIE